MKIPDVKEEKTVYLHKPLGIIVEFSASNNSGVFGFKTIPLLLSFLY